MHLPSSAFCLLICGAVLWPSHLLAQQPAGNEAAEPAGANRQMPAAQMVARADPLFSAHFGAPPPAVPVINPPDPLNPGTLAETARNTALARYPGQP